MSLDIRRQWKRIALSLIAETEPVANQEAAESERVWPTAVASLLYTGKCVASCASTVQKESAMGDITVSSNAVHGSGTQPRAGIHHACLCADTCLYTNAAKLVALHRHSGIQQYAKVYSKWLKRLQGCSASVHDVRCFSQCMDKGCSGRMSMKHKIWTTSDAYEYFGMLWILI